MAGATIQGIEKHGVWEGMEPINDMDFSGAYRKGLAGDNQVSAGRMS